MNLPHRLHPETIAPIQRTRAAWNQALLGAASAADNRLILDLDAAGRIDAGLIASLALVEQELVRRGGTLRLHATDPNVRALIALAGLLRLLPAAGGPPLDLLCATTFGDDQISVTVQHDIGLNPRLSNPASHGWIGCVAMLRATIDLGELSHVNSVIVAWLLQLAQAAKPAELVLINVNCQVVIQFNQLRLNHVLKVQARADG